jgi:hypothetical protein
MFHLGITGNDDDDDCIHANLDTTFIGETANNLGFKRACMFALTLVNTTVTVFRADVADISQKDNSMKAWKWLITSIYI